MTLRDRLDLDARLRRRLYLAGLARRRMWDNAPANPPPGLLRAMEARDAEIIADIQTLVGRILSLGWTTMSRCERLANADKNS